MIWIVLLTIAVMGLVGYVLLLIWEAKQEVASSPRAEMFLCNKHGAIPSKYLIQLDTAGITDEPIPFCPFCFDEKMKAAARAGNGKSH